MFYAPVDFLGLGIYLDSGLKIAVSGKGGVGKTTVSAVLAHLFAQEGFDVLAIDADPDANLAGAFGVAAEKSPVALIDMKELIEERTGSKGGAYGQYFKLNPKVDDLPEKYWVEVDGLKLLVLGSIEKAGSGCACPEGAFLKALLLHTVLHRKEVVVVDLAAGVEFMGRACVQGIDALVVVEPGSRSIETAKNISNMAQSLGIKRVVAFINKVTDVSQIEAIEAELGNVPVIGSFKYDSSVQLADLKRLSVVESSAELVEKLRKAKKKLVDF